MNPFFGGPFFPIGAPFIGGFLGSYLGNAFAPRPRYRYPNYYRPPYYRPPYYRPPYNRPPYNGPIRYW